MCRVEERIYINGDGHRSKFEEAFPCDKSRKGRLCSKVQKRTTEYFPKSKGPSSRHESSPSPKHPPTPTSSTTPYIVQPVGPSSTAGRPSMRDGQIVIEFGSGKSKGKNYPILSVSSPSHKRASLDSIGSHEHVLESPGSDTAHPISTGFIEVPIPPQTSIYGSYNSATTIPHGTHRRHPSSTSSFTGSSQPPSLYITSDADYDSTNEHIAPQYPGNMGYGSMKSTAHSSSSSARSQSKQASGKYATAIVEPKEPQGLFPIDNADFADRSGSSRASSGGSSHSRRIKDHGESRRRKEEEQRRHEELDREVAEALAKEENVKQVRFELGRSEARARERAENLHAENEKRRAIEREESRQKKKEKERERDEPRKSPRKDSVREPKKEYKKEKSGPPATDNSKRPSSGRRLSMSRSQVDEQRRLLEADMAQVYNESAVTEAREREEFNVSLRQHPDYYNPRAGPPVPVPTMPSSSNATSLVRRPSQSRRGSISNNEPRPVLARVSQPDPPTANTSNQGSGSYSRPSVRTHQPPPVSFPTNFNPRPSPSRRNSVSFQENPFAAPPTRGSGSSIDNPFVPVPQVISPSAPVHQIMSPSATIHQDPWDVRAVRDALPSARQSADGRYTAEQRTHDYSRNPSSSHYAAKQATRAMRGATHYDDEYALSSEDELTHAHARMRR